MEQNPGVGPLRTMLKTMALIPCICLFLIKKHFLSREKTSVPPLA